MITTTIDRDRRVVEARAVTGDAGGSTNSTQMKATQMTAIQPITALYRPRFHGPGTKRGVQPAQQDRHDVGDVEADDRDRGDGQVGDGSSPEPGWPA